MFLLRKYNIEMQFYFIDLKLVVDGLVLHGEKEGLWSVVFGRHLAGGMQWGIRYRV